MIKQRPPAGHLYHSVRWSNRSERRRVHVDLHVGREPQAKYRTGKIWFD